jgi:hypothetical protein
MPADPPEPLIVLPSAGTVRFDDITVGDVVTVTWHPVAGAVSYEITGHSAEPLAFPTLTGTVKATFESPALQTFAAAANRHERRKALSPRAIRKEARKRG